VHLILYNWFRLPSLATVLRSAWSARSNGRSAELVGLGSRSFVVVGEWQRGPQV
jgi:hypothetical protein